MEEKRLSPELIHKAEELLTRFVESKTTMIISKEEKILLGEYFQDIFMIQEFPNVTNYDAGTFYTMLMSNGKKMIGTRYEIHFVKQKDLFSQTRYALEKTCEYVEFKVDGPQNPLGVWVNCAEHYKTGKYMRVCDRDEFEKGIKYANSLFHDPKMEDVLEYKIYKCFRSCLLYVCNQMKMEAVIFLNVWNDEANNCSIPPAIVSKYAEMINSDYLFTTALSDYLPKETNGMIRGINVSPSKTSRYLFANISCVGFIKNVHIDKKTLFYECKTDRMIKDNPVAQIFLKRFDKEERNLE